MKRVVSAVTSNSGSSLNRLKALGLRKRPQTLQPSAFSLFSAFSLIFIALLLFSEVCVGGEIIRDAEVDGLYSMKKEELLYLLDIKNGEELNPDKITIGIKRAFLKGIFDDIRVYHEGEGRLKIDVKERDIVETISIEGNRYLPDRDIKKYIAALPFKEGEIMRYDLLDRLRDHLIKSLKERGFPHCKVELDITNTGKPYRVRLLIKIEEGEPEHIKGLTIIGDGSVRELLGLDKGDIFNREGLLKGIERIKRYYKKEGRVNFVIGPYTFSEGELSIHINPGKRLNISFYGNETISSKTLLKELSFVDFEIFRDEMLEEAVSNLKSLYHQKGFFNPQIAPVISEDNENINLSFYIFEGKKVKIKSIKFSGITLNEKNLKEIMTAKEGEFLNPEALSYDRDIIHEFYNALGYLKAEVDEPVSKIEGSEAEILINIKEGSQTIIEDISIEGNRVLSEQSIKASIMPLRKGSPYNEVDLSDARYRLLDLCSSLGLLDADITVKREFVEGDRGVRITFIIKEGEPTYFGKTIIKGNKKTNNIVIERELIHHEGEPFNYSFLTRERQKLYKLGLFTEVDIEPLDRYDSKKDVIMTFKEGDAGAVEFGIGYGDYEKYRGFLDLSYRNLFGMNRQGSLRIELSSLEERVILNYYE
ncbi:MAG: POTRA domain-containing protein, partial [Thermodesulfovibrionales bacterium]